MLACSTSDVMRANSAKFVPHAGNMKLYPQNEVYMSLHVSLYLCICLHITSSKIHIDDYRRNYYKMELTT